MSTVKLIPGESPNRGDRETLSLSSRGRPLCSVESAITAGAATEGSVSLAHTGNPYRRGLAPAGEGASSERHRDALHPPGRARERILRIPLAGRVANGCSFCKGVLPWTGRRDRRFPQAAGYRSPVARRAAGSVTPTDLRVLDFITGFEAEHGRPPHLREIAAGMGWKAHGPAQRHVDALIAAGRLTRGSASARPVKETPRGPRVVPLVEGLAPDGSLDLSRAEIGVTEPVTFGEGTFAVLVPDYGMEPAGLLQGSIAYVKRTNAVQTGQVVLARVEEPGRETALLIRRYEVRPRSVVLVADVSGYPNVRVDTKAGQRVHIEGVVMACLTLVR